MAREARGQEEQKQSYEQESLCHSKSWGRRGGEDDRAAGPALGGLENDRQPEHC
jgi:hypothetical protein